MNLETAIQIATTNFFALQAIKNKDEAIKHRITERWRDYLPSVGIGYIRQRYIVADGQDSIYNELRLNIEQVIYDGGKRGMDLDIARMDEILNREDFMITYNKVRLDVQKAFFAVLGAIGKIALNEKSLQRGRAQLKQARLELSQGFSTNIQVMSIASRVEEIDLALLKSKNEFLRSKNDLKLVMSLDHSVDLVLEGDLFRDYYLFKPNFEMDKLIARARNDKPEVMKAKVNIMRAEKEKEIAESAWIPKLAIGGYAGKTGEVFPLREDTWGVNVRLTFPLGNSTNNTTTNSGVRPNSLAATNIRDGNTNFNNSTNSTTQFYDNLSYNRLIMESKIKLGEAVTEKRRLEQIIAIEVNKVCDSTKESWDSIHIGNGQVYFRYESLRLMTTKYNIGEVKRADILFAETELVEAQSTLVDSLSKYLIFSYELEWASGLKPGTLGLFKYNPGKGNTLFSQILDDDFSRPRVEIKAKDLQKGYILDEYRSTYTEEKETPENEFIERNSEKNKRSEKDRKKSEYIIDEVNIE